MVGRRDALALPEDALRWCSASCVSAVLSSGAAFPLRRRLLLSVLLVSGFVERFRAKERRAYFDFFQQL